MTVRLASISAQVRNPWAETVHLLTISSSGPSSCLKSSFETISMFSMLTAGQYSCVANYEGAGVEISEYQIKSGSGHPADHIHLIVANDQGSFTTPSFVSFTAEERLIGEAAKNQAAMNPENTVFDVK